MRAEVAGLKAKAVRLLESHPLGYVVGVAVLDSTDRFLPHEIDYLGFSVIAERGFSGARRLLDLGANHGHSARAFLKLLPTWRVTSFEANPIHQRRLAQIQGRFSARFDFQVAAVSDKSGAETPIFTPYYGPFAMHSAASTNPDDAMNGVQEQWPKLRGRFHLQQAMTRSLAIDDLSLEIGFAKLDIQGTELAALKGMEATIRRSNPIVLVEMNLTRDDLVGYFAGLECHPWSFDASAANFYPGIKTETRNVFFVPTCHEGLVAH